MRYALERECRRLLSDTFGLTDYRPGQKEAVHALLSGRDVMCILPTGAGKSLCWQLPAVAHAGLTVVVSPLIALMRDQVQHLAEIGVPAVSMDSLMSREEKQAALEEIRRGKARIVFVSPERLMQQRFRQLCRELQPWLVVVDEAHCVVQWGESFRLAYSGIADFLQALENRPALCALTATADETVQRSIALSLGMRRPKRILLPIVRDNLVYSVRTTLDRTAEIQRMLSSRPAKTVIFCRSRARTEKLAERLKEAGIPAMFYHAGMERADRLEVQQRFMEAGDQTLCATKAFGMGVDIPDIRRVVHDCLPEDLIDYVQQSGRAGRDGEAAECVLFLEPNELVARSLTGRQADQGDFLHPLRRWRRRLRSKKKMKQLLHVVMASQCIPAGIAVAFGKPVPPCGRCSACVKGRLVRWAPALAGMKAWQVRAWLLMWQREVLAKQMGCSPAAILPDRSIRAAAKKLVLPQGAEACPGLERLLAHFRRAGVHEEGEKRIS